MANFIFERRAALKRRHYLLLANQVTHWFNAAPNVMQDYRARFGDDCCVLWRDGPEDDAYVIPFKRLRSLFTEKNLVRGSGEHLRWHGGIRGNDLSLRSTEETVHVADCYNAFELLTC